VTASYAVQLGLVSSVYSIDTAADGLTTVLAHFCRQHTLNGITLSLFPSQRQALYVMGDANTTLAVYRLNLADCSISAAFSMPGFRRCQHRARAPLQQRLLRLRVRQPRCVRSGPTRQHRHLIATVAASYNMALGFDSELCLACHDCNGGLYSLLAA
jgi:hypothetical protein